MDIEPGEAFWRARAEQLQHALSSRVVIEQAKGVLGERLGLDMPTAFALLRQAARNSQMKLQDMAEAVVQGDETPRPVIETLARHAELLTRAPRAERVVQTERFFRAINDELARLEGVAPVEYVCECGNPACAERIALSNEVRARLHAEQDLFVVIRGHEIPDVESVVDEADGCLIVRKDA